MKKPISTTSEWNIELIEAYDKEIGRIARDFKLDTYPNQIEIINSEQMIDAYTSTGMPMGYHHWSFGKKFLNIEKNYKQGRMGLAYELVINSNPCISYLMEENSMTMQAIVIAHACYGHNSFFKNNYLFKMWTSADGIVDYLAFAKHYIAECEEKYGIDEVEELLDACHALINYGVDRYKHPSKLSLHEEKIKQKNRESYLESQVNELWKIFPHDDKKSQKKQEDNFPQEPQENILYFIEKNAPLLKTWQREIIRIVRKIAQYFYPQSQTKLMNEGWACFWHYTILNALYEEGLVTDEFMLEFLQSHTNVIQQPGFDEPHYSGINPYALGYHLFQNIKRVCQNPSEEDKQWLPQIAHTDWLTAVDFAMRNFRDESFIAQYLSPHLIREFKLFNIVDDEQNSDLLVSAIHNEHGYQRIRDTLSKQYNLSYIEPNIQIHRVEMQSDRTLILRHIEQDKKPLADNTREMLKYLHYLWRFPVRLETVTLEGEMKKVFSYPEK